MPTTGPPRSGHPPASPGPPPPARAAASGTADRASARAGRHGRNLRRLLRGAACAIAAVALAPATARPALAECGRESVRVDGRPEEVAEACRAIDAVSAYFSAMGLEPIRAVTVRFADRVVVGLTDPEGRTPPSEAVVSGVYVVGADEVRVTSAHRGAGRDRAPWGIPWGQPIAYSILEHELAHAAIAENLGADYASMDPAWHEFVAYAVQFALMDAGLRSEILARNPGVEPFTSAEGVNRVIHAADPDAFGLRAHLFAEANGGATFLAALLTHRTTISTGRVDVLWTE